MIGTCLCVLVPQSCLSPCDPMDCSPPGSSVHGNSPGKNTEVDCHALLQRFFPTQGLNPRLLCLLHWHENSLPLEPPGKPNSTTPVFLQGEFHGQRSLADYSPWGCKELDMTERLTHTVYHTQMFKR